MTFAFLVHPRADLRRDMARLATPLGLVPNVVYDHALRRLPLPPLRFATVELNGREVGRLVLVPFGARHLLTDRRTGARKVAQAVDLAAATGASLVGLGGLTSPVTNGGRQLVRRTDIGVTNGNAFTAATVHRQVRELLAAAPAGRVAVVGATGSVGSAVTRLLARDGLGADLLLVARDRSRLDSVTASVGARSATELAAIAACDVVVMLTSAADAVIGPEHLGRGAVVLDATQPRNTGPELLRRRPDVRVLDGGVVAVPGMRLRGGSIGLPPGQAFACLAETMLLSLHGHRGHFGLGRPALDQVDRVVEIADAFGDLGFRPAAPSSFGRPVVPMPPVVRIAAAA
jgi:fatty aldehyde-generating acyl-ACP reductase